MDFTGNLTDREIYFIIGIAFFFFLVFLIPFIFYLITLQNTLKAVSPENRKMPPTNVWLLFIPLFNLIWMFFVADAIGTSLKSEYEKYGIFQNEKPTYSLGLAMAILECCSIIPILGSLAAIGGFVCWIIYWVKVNTCKNEILNLHLNSNLPEGEKSIFL